MTVTAPQVDFYILPTKNHQSLLQFCCRLAEKAWKKGNNIHIQTNNSEETNHLDKLMWTYSDSSFLPHATQSENITAPIIIGHEADIKPSDLLINLAVHTPTQHTQFSRIAEILNDDDSIKTNGRIRYAEYKKMGCDLHHHDIKS